MKFIQDKELKYKDILEKRLEVFNENITGVRDYDQKHLYLFRNSNLIAYVDVEYTWDWIIIRKIYYQDLEALKQIMLNLKNKYNKAVGIQIKLWDKKVITDFKNTNFNISGIFKDMPLGYDRFVLTLYLDKVINNKNNFTYRFIDKEDPKYIDYLSNIKIFPNQSLADAKKELSYICLDNEKFVGGFHGYFQMNYFYLNFLYVDEEYRGKKISSKLIKIMEEELKKMDIHNIYLFTCSFQAPEFYEKQGYINKFIIKDEPKGYNVNMFYKRI